MSFLHQFVSFFLHIDTHLGSILQEYGALTYLILFVIIFCETGLVVTPFLPGDSLLFAAGAFAAKGYMNIAILWLLLFAAAVLGNFVNFSIGRWIGRSASNWHLKYVKKEYLDRTHAFFLKHGPITIVVTRFMPILRTMAPFVAGIGTMPVGRFIVYNLFGGFLWIALLLGGGYFFGTIPFVEEHFSSVILVIIVVSILPGVVGWLRSKK